MPHRTTVHPFSSQQIRATEVAKLVSQAWKDLSDKSRSYWLELGRKDRQRYDREKAAYKGPWKVPDMKDPKAPKRPMSAFLSFSNERRKAVVKENPNMSGTEISRALSEMWRECPTDIKQIYQEKESVARQKYKKDREIWENQRDGATSIASSLDDSTRTSANQDDVDNTMVNVPTVESRSSASSVEDSNVTDEDYSDMFAFSEIIFGKDPFLNNIETTKPLELKSKHGDFSSTECLSPPKASKTYSVPFYQNGYVNCTLKDILESDELFEDFSPSSCPNCAYRSAARD